MASEQQGGRIITFYSYKGGTGRSMALANTAWALANNGQRVLVVDWDLEAPGIHRYFHPFLADQALKHSPGLIDLVIDYATEVVTPLTEETASEPPEPPTPQELLAQPWFQRKADILRYARSLKWDFGPGGSLDFIPAGRQDAAYATRVNSFDWSNFYRRLSGSLFMEAVRQRMRAEYDYVLIDSRTGVSDTSGICTVEMPDALVVFFTLNNQSIDGAAGIAQSVHRQRGELPVFPVPSRLHNDEQKKVDRQLDRVYRKFEQFPQGLTESERSHYWKNVAIPYASAFAFEEILAVFGEKHRLANSIATATEHLTGYVTGNRERGWRVEVPDYLRLPVLAQFEGVSAAEPTAPGASLLSEVDRNLQRLHAEDQQVARRLLTRLVRLAPPEEGGEDTRLRFPEKELDPPAQRLVPVLVQAGLIERHASSAEASVQFADERFIREWQLMRRWLEEDRPFLLWRQQLRAEVLEWERAGKSQDKLLPPSRLERARQWKQRYETDLSHVERDFLDRSEAALKAPASASARYDAFISYAMEDRREAQELTAELQRLAPPSFGKSPRLYIDIESHAIGASLQDQTRTAISQASRMVLLASPAAARSPYIAHELTTWLWANGPERLILVLLDGEITWDSRLKDFDWTRTTALPRTLAGTLASEPRVIDMRRARDRSQGLAHLAAVIYGVSQESLLHENVRGLRRQASVTRIAAMAFGAISILASSFALWWSDQEQQKLQERAHREHEEKLQLLKQLDELSAASLTLRELVIAQGPETQPLDSKTGYVLMRDNEGDLSLKSPYGKERKLTVGYSTASSISPDGSTIASGFKDGRLLFWWADTGKLKSETKEKLFPAVERIAMDAQGNRALVLQEGGSVSIVNVSNGELARLDVGTRIEELGFGPDGQSAILVGVDKVCTVDTAKGTETSCTRISPSTESPPQQNLAPPQQQPAPQEMK